MRGMFLAFALAGALLIAGCGGGSKGSAGAGMPSTPTTRGQTQLLRVEGTTGDGEIPASWDTLDVSPIDSAFSAPQYNVTDSDTVRPSCNGSRCTVGTETIDLRDTPSPDSYRISSASTVGTYNGVTIGRARLTGDDVSASGSTSVSGVRVRYSGVMRNPSLWGHWAILDHSAFILASQGQASGSATYTVTGRPSLNVALRLDDMFFGYVAGASTPSGMVSQVLGETGASETLQWRGAATWVYRRSVSHGAAFLNWGRVGLEHKLTLRIPDAGIDVGRVVPDIGIDGNSFSGATARSGVVRGKFYGPNAEEAAGWFRELGENNFSYRTGVFGVKR